MSDPAVNVERIDIGYCSGRGNEQIVVNMI